MSLSKYYKRSNSFQPEELVKPAVPKPKGWESTTKDGPESTEFKEEYSSIPQVSDGELEGSDRTHQADTGNDSLDAENISGTISPSESEASLTGDESPGSADPNYIEKSVAEEQIVEAYQRGLLDGEEKAEQDFGNASRALLSTCQQLDTVRETLIANSRTEVVDFALAIAERILRISLREQDETIVATIEEALQRAVKSEEFCIYIHPDNYEKIAEKSEDLIAGISGLSKIIVKKDSTLEPGGAKITSDNCTIDCTISSQFDVIREELQKEI